MDGSSKTFPAQLVQNMAKHHCFVCLQDVCVESGEVETNSTTLLTCELIDPNHVLPALKSFLEQLMRSR